MYILCTLMIFCLHFSENIVIPDKLMDFVELILDPETESRLIEQKRVPGENNVGMIAWRLTLYTPEYPSGRDIIVIANDVTYLIGSFGPREDKVYNIVNFNVSSLYISSSTHYHRCVFFYRYLD